MYGGLRTKPCACPQDAATSLSSRPRNHHMRRIRSQRYTLITSDRVSETGCIPLPGLSSGKAAQIALYRPDRVGKSHTDQLGIGDVWPSQSPSIPRVANYLEYANARIERRHLPGSESFRGWKRTQRHRSRSRGTKFVNPCDRTIPPETLGGLETTRSATPIAEQNSCWSTAY